ncbi:hypothetical protein ASG80_21530 [Agromyces sp. Soil535]|nr:hypothetical protein ASG80_21530 [Agromyces sp. Soil535]
MVDTAGTIMSVELDGTDTTTVCRDIYRHLSARWYDAVPFIGGVSLYVDDEASMLVNGEPRKPINDTMSLMLAHVGRASILRGPGLFIASDVRGMPLSLSDEQAARVTSAWSAANRAFALDGAKITALLSH